MRALIVDTVGLLRQPLAHAVDNAGIESVGHDLDLPSVLANEPGQLDELVRSSCSNQAPDVVFLDSGVGVEYDFEEGSHATRSSDLPAHLVRLVLDNTSAACKVVYFSTDRVFGNLPGPYSELDTPAPSTVVGSSALLAEQELRASNRSFLILRTSSVFGWDRRSNNLSNCLWRSLTAGDSVEIADAFCNPTIVDYLAEVAVRLLELGTNGIVNVAGMDRIERLELFNRLTQIMGLDPTRLRVKPSQGSAAGGLRTERLVSILHSEPPGWPQQLRRFARVYRADTYQSLQSRASPERGEDLKQDILARVSQYVAIAHKAPDFVPFTSSVPYAGRVFGPEEVVSLVESALRFWLTLGPDGERFENRMRQYFGCRDFVAVNSGSAANLTALLTLSSPQVPGRLLPGDEVITPAVTFPTTIAPIIHGGMIPVLVDCEVGTYNVKPELIEEALSPRTRAIVVPHTLGNPCDMDIICDVARRNDLFLVEDTCDALGSTFRGRLVGTFGDLATLSFFPAHHITTGEGGAVIVNRHGLSRIVRSVRDWGRDCWCPPGESNTCGRRFGWNMGDLPPGYDHKFIYSNLGYNFKPTDLQAAIGAVQAERIPDFLAKRRANSRRIYKALEPYQEFLILPKTDDRADPAWFGFPLTVTGGLKRGELISWLEAARIETRQIFAGNIMAQPGYRETRCRIATSLEQSDRIMRDSFFIGVYPGLTDEMIEFVIERFHEFFRLLKRRRG